MPLVEKVDHLETQLADTVARLAALERGMREIAIFQLKIAESLRETVQVSKAVKQAVDLQGELVRKLQGL